ncbi:hypothetical protein BYT27DRAFT_7226507 [Phlegmacium glaucopus]|nr:hypothetical protein BYT27DRAFT_7226507 [Phlegmacium glaucopus]
MSSLRLQDAVLLTKQHPELSFASRLKDDILLAQPSSVLALNPPDVLPPTISTFLINSCGISVACVEACWDMLKTTIWYDAQSLEDSLIQHFAAHGHSLGLYAYMLYPPQHTCTNASCPRNRTGKLLKKEEQRQAVLYTMDKGALPVQSVHLYCDECRTNYHHNFQVGEHQFAEKRLVQLWIMLMLVSWTSATNCAHLYNLSLSDTVPPGDWAFGFSVTTEQVWDAFVILALLEDHQSQLKTLAVPHTGAQKDRFTNVLHARNLRFRLYGQLELRHFCNKCLRVYQDGKKVWVVVIDGVTVGCPCCAVHNCKVPLENNRHHYCPQDAHRNTICAVVGCESPIVADSRMCSEPAHQEVGWVHQERGQASFQLKERLQRALVAHPNNVIAEDGTDLADVEDEVEDFEISGSERSIREQQIQAQLGRRCTHNEQIIVAPCGMIIAQETFYGAEGVGSVIEMIKHTFHEDIKPDHIFFDNNCTLASISKHSETDTFFQENCNPAAYPELVSEDNKGWYFNSSIAEQTNVWLGSYHAICREMLVDKYTFFLDEMILRRNRMT